jgi:hypothetical protein
MMKLMVDNSTVQSLNVSHNYLTTQEHVNEFVMHAENLMRNNAKTLRHLDISHVLIDRNLQIDLTSILKCAATESLALESFHIQNPGIDQKKIEHIMGLSHNYENDFQDLKA